MVRDDRHQCTFCDIRVSNEFAHRNDAGNRCFDQDVGAVRLEAIQTT